MIGVGSKVLLPNGKMGRVKKDGGGNGTTQCWIIQVYGEDGRHGAFTRDLREVVENAGADKVARVQPSSQEVPSKDSQEASNDRSSPSVDTGGTSDGIIGTEDPSGNDEGEAVDTSGSNDSGDAGDEDDTEVKA